MDNSIRDNTKDILRDLLMEQGNMGFDEANEKAADIADEMGLDSKYADKEGSARGVIISVVKGIATLVHQPANTKVVIIDFDLEAGDPVRITVS